MLIAVRLLLKLVFKNRDLHTVQRRILLQPHLES